ncbi:Actin-related protein 10 [Exaiptasia diaphana]|nr:Actin-related protein 10 [Exaiptasia diaphana]
MPLFDIIGLGGEKNAVVIDIGTAYTKCGFAKEAAPRHIIPSYITHTVNGTTNTEYVFENDKRNPDELYAVLRDFIHMIYFRYLLVNPRDRRVVICESVLCPTLFRETIAKVLFKHFEVPSVLFAPCHLVSLFTLGVPTGISIIKAVTGIPLAAKSIHEYLEKQLMDRSLVQIEKGIKPLSSVMASLPEDILEDIKVRTCFVAPKFSGPKDEPRPASLVHQVDYPLDGGRILRIEGQIREQTYDILFDGDEEEKSIATALLDSLLMCPIDTRKTLAENIVVIGGTAMAPGFKHRLIQEIYILLQSPQYKDRLFIKTVKMHQTPVSSNCAAWLGGAIFGSLEILPDRSVTKEQYMQDKKIPDWMQCDIPVELQPASEELQRPTLSRRQTSGITSTLSSLSSKLSSHILGSSSNRLSSQLGRTSTPGSSPNKSIQENPAEEKKSD